MNAKILVIDDETQILELLEMNLSREGFIVRTAKNAAEALACIKRQRPDLILLDVVLPDISGMELTGRLKHTPDTADIPIILITAKDTEADIVVGLNMGADDYVTKPFTTAVLTARMTAVLRRLRKTPKSSDDVLSFGPVQILIKNHQVLVAGQSVELTLAEYEILLALIEAGGAVLSRDELQSKLTDSGPEVSDRIIDVHIATLRKKLASARDIIKTVHRLGYRVSK